MPVNIELSIRSTTGRHFVYRSEGDSGDVGRVIRAYFQGDDGPEMPIPWAGNIHDLCESYPLAKATWARLAVENDEWVFVDETGDGRIDRVEGRGAGEVSDVVQTISEAAMWACHQKGRSLYALLGDSVGPSDVPTIPGSCGSEIKLIAESARYKQYAILNATLQSGQPPNEVHRYKIGGDIFFVFTRGQALVNHTAGGLREFRSVPVSISAGHPWHIVILPPQEFYQVLNTGTELVEYFMFFMEHNDAYARNAFAMLTREENTVRGWGFAYTEGRT